MEFNPQPDSFPLPRASEAHVWTVLIPETLSQLSAFDDLLSQDEKDRAARFHCTDDRNRYVVAHGILRQLLGRYLSMLPETLAFTTNSFGKPTLSGHGDQQLLSFNLSHSGEVILFAFALRRKIGIDVEKIRTDIAVLDLAAGQFGGGEVQELRQSG
jgi:4'-phosphopantetheinyl transferase